MNRMLAILLILSMLGVAASCADKKENPVDPVVSTPQAPSNDCVILGNSRPSTNGLGSVSGYYTSSGYRAEKFEVARTVTVSSLTVRVYNPPAGAEMRLALYSHTPNRPLSLLSQSNSQPVSLGWNLFNIAPTTLSPGTYWFAYLTNGSAQAIYVYFADGGSPTTDHAFGTAAVYGPFPDAFPNPPTNVYNYAQSCLYTVACP
jgi:hypothetical protein